MPDLLPFTQTTSPLLNVPEAKRLFVTPSDQMIAGSLPPAPVPTGSDSKKVIKIAIGIAAAFMLYRLLIHKELPDSSPDDVQKEADKAWEKIRGPWSLVASAAVFAAYKLGSSGQVPDSQLESVANSYALEMGNYIHQTSSLALSEGVEMQLLAGWSDKVAWQRAKAGYGLDGPQMRSYLNQIITATKTNENLPTSGQIVPDSFKTRIQTMLLTRSDTIAESESWSSIQTGKALNWLFMVKSGRLKGTPQKRWITAEDELVCPICAPLHGITIPVGDMFESKGHKFFAPGVHPNCRCELQLIEDLPNTVSKSDDYDPYKRDWHGRFARVDNDTRPAVTPVAPRNIKGEMAALELIAQNLGGFSSTQQMTLVRPTEVLQELQTTTQMPSLVDTQIKLDNPLLDTKIDFGSTKLDTEILLDAPKLDTEILLDAPKLDTEILLDAPRLDTDVKLDQKTELGTKTDTKVDTKVDTKTKTEGGAKPQIKTIGWSSTPPNLMGQYAEEYSEPLQAGNHRIFSFDEYNPAGAEFAAREWLAKAIKDVSSASEQINKINELHKDLAGREADRIAEISKILKKYNFSANEQKLLAMDYARASEDIDLVNYINKSNSNESMQDLENFVRESNSNIETTGISLNFAKAIELTSWGSEWMDRVEAKDFKAYEEVSSLEDLKWDIESRIDEYNRELKNYRDIGADIEPLEIVFYPEGYEVGQNGGVSGNYIVGEEVQTVHWNSRVVPATLKEVLSRSLPEENSGVLINKSNVYVKIYTAKPAEQTEE